MNKLKLFALASIFSFSLISCERENRNDDDSIDNYDIVLSGAQVVPASSSAAQGSIQGTYNPKTKTFNYQVRWSGLSGNISSMHIHGIADKGFIAIPVAPLSAYPNGIVQTITGYSSGTTGLFTGSLFVDGTVVKLHDLLAGKFYIDIHTAAHPNGEIRGQIMFR
ncbi:MAG: CHRD domain-containing protein [Flavisolibacter sp.]